VTGVQTDDAVSNNVETQDLSDLFMNESQLIVVLFTQVSFTVDETVTKVVDDSSSTECIVGISRWWTNQHGQHHYQYRVVIIITAARTTYVRSSPSYPLMGMMDNTSDAWESASPAKKLGQNDIRSTYDGIFDIFYTFIRLFWLQLLFDRNPHKNYVLLPVFFCL
jgi:hypothetical protein